ncbi:hypothetical protein Fcan01_19664 [Folsomia candida]|uniref:Uncharacterized protein n=1 Tax=Folsomia candida TaxID=158441 RepID=A0A226DJJ9_FOLCA|nr:hypothetical protein Fcan01_19664 [Folsomia candida]
MDGWMDERHAAPMDAMSLQIKCGSQKNVVPHNIHQIMHSLCLSRAGFMQSHETRERKSADDQDLPTAFSVRQPANTIANRTSTMQPPNFCFLHTAAAATPKLQRAALLCKAEYQIDPTKREPYVMNAIHLFFICLATLPYLLSAPPSHSMTNSSLVNISADPSNTHRVKANRIRSVAAEGTGGQCPQASAANGPQDNVVESFLSCSGGGSLRDNLPTDIRCRLHREETGAEQHQIREKRGLPAADNALYSTSLHPK